MAGDDEFYHLYGDEEYDRAFHDSMYEPYLCERLNIEEVKEIAKSYPTYYRRRDADQ